MTRSRKWLMAASIVVMVVMLLGWRAMGARKAREAAAAEPAAKAEEIGRAHV